MTVETILSLLTLAAFVVDLAIRVVKTIANAWAQRPTVAA